MPQAPISPGAAITSLRRFFAHIATGGDWAVSLPTDTRRNLRWFFFDGLFASASDNIVVTYLTFYILALGATSAQIGFLSSLTSLMAAIMLIPGAFLAERMGRRKDIAIWGGGGVGRLALLLLTLLPFAFGGQTVVYLAIALSITRDSFGNLSYPAWISIVGDIVPLEGRGRYFGSRNFIMGVAGMVTVLFFGEFITRVGQPVGYQIALGLAFAIGMVSTFSFSHIRDPHPEAVARKVPSAAKISPLMLLKDVWQHTGFVKLCIAAILWNFSLNIAGPFFNVYMALELHVTPTLIAINSTVSAVAGMLAQLIIGRFADRWGPRRLVMITGFLIPLLPFAWVFITEGWQIIPVNTFGGALWGIYGLASFNLLLEATPEAQRARYSAIYQNLVMLSLAAGAALGGIIITYFGYHAIFMGSSAGRFIAAILFALLVRPPNLQKVSERSG